MCGSAPKPSDLLSKSNLKKAFSPKAAINFAKSPENILLDPAGLVTGNANTAAGGGMGELGEFAADPAGIYAGAPEAPKAPDAVAEAPTAAAAAGKYRTGRAGSTGGTLLTGPRGLTKKATTQQKTLLGS